MTGGLTATGLLARLDLRRERIVAPVTIAVLIATNAATVSSIRTLYGTPHERAALAAGAADNSAFKLLLGPLEHLQSTASVASWRAGLFMITATAVCAVLMVTRSTRKEEELGRVELVRAARTGRLAPLTAAILVATGFGVVVGAGMAVLMASAGASAPEAAAVGGQYAATSLAAIGLAALTAQLATTARLANLIAVSIVVGGYVVRGAADAAGWEWLRWTNPVGWAQQMDPFGANTWWPTVLSAAFFAVAVTAAMWASGRRDLGGGLVAPRPGPASSEVSSSTRLVAELAKGGYAGWLVAMGAYGLLIGVLVNAAASLSADNPQMLEYLHRVGGPGALSAVFLAVIMTYLGFAAAAWAVTVVVRAQADEAQGRTEVLLATPTSRTRLVADQLGLIVGGVVGLLAVAGVFVGIGAAAVTGEWSMLSAAVRGASVQIPAALVIGVGAFALYAVSPRFAVGGGWAMVVAAFLLGPMGELFGLTQGVRDLSPFTHLPLVPSQPMRWGPVVALLAVIAALGVLAWWRFGRRDIEGR